LRIIIIITIIIIIIIIIIIKWSLYNYTQHFWVEFSPVIIIIIIINYYYYYYYSTCDGKPNADLVLCNRLCLSADNNSLLTYLLTFLSFNTQAQWTNTTISFIVQYKRRNT